MGELLFTWIPCQGLPADQLVRALSAAPASSAAQSAALSAPRRRVVLSVLSACWSRHTRSACCACLRRELSGEPDAGNPPVRFDEGRGTCGSPPTLLFRGPRFCSQLSSWNP